MRFGSLAVAGFAGLGLLLSAASSTSASGNTMRPAMGSRFPIRRHPHFAVTPTYCTADDPVDPYFVGLTGANDFAGENDSAVLGGAGNEACDLFTSIAGGFENTIGQENTAAETSFIGGGDNNVVVSLASSVVAGAENETTGKFSFVGAGEAGLASGAGAFLGAGGSAVVTAGNDMPGSSSIAGGIDSFVGGGDLNQIGSAGNGSFIGGGGYAFAAGGATTAGNQITASDSFVGAGNQNVVAASQAFIGGGAKNAISAAGTYGAIAGGKGNVIAAAYGAAGGGEANLASGTVSTLPGGYHNIASGVASFAAGYIAEALTAGSFAWSDESSTTVHVRTTVPNEFVARAAGGVYFYSNPALTSGVRLSPGSGAWSSMSDRAMKTGVTPLNDAAVLAKVAALPVSEWSYRSERGVRHVGPMAQDFYAAFGVGEDDRHITSIDEDGVALAAIKALHTDNAQLHAENRQLHAENARMHADMRGMRARFDALERKFAALATVVETHGTR